MANHAIKIIMLAATMLMPQAGASFVSANMEMSVDEASPVPADGSITINAHINFSWGFGVIIPTAVTIYIDAENVPDWLSVTCTPSSFVITPTGFRGGSIKRDIEVHLTSKQEIEAFTQYSFTLHAHTNGNFLIGGADAKKAVAVMQDFADHGIQIDHPSKVECSSGEEKTIYLNITNDCNAPVTISIERLNNSSAYSVSYDNNIIIPSKSQKQITMKIEAREIGTFDMPFRVTYYPTGYPGKSNAVTFSISLESKGMETDFVGVISIAIAIIIVAVIIAIAWKKLR